MIHAEQPDPRSNAQMQRTRRIILDHLKRHPGATLEELAAAAGTAAITARAHVNLLVEQGLLEYRDVRGGRGRPFRRYSLTDAAEAHFPKQYDQLAVSLLSGLGELEGQAGVAALIDHVAERMAAGHRPRVEGRPMEERVAAVSEIIDEQGGATEWEVTADGYVVRERNCPYLSVSRHDAHVCELDRKLIEKLAGADVDVAQRLRDGAESCVFVIAKAER
jgi:predicted ArsR family transcriptional regulator